MAADLHPAPSIFVDNVSNQFLEQSILAESNSQPQNSAVLAVGETGISGAASASGNSNPAPQISGGVGRFDGAEGPITTVETELADG